MKRRVLAVLVITILVLGLVAGCGNKNEKTDGGEVLMGVLAYDVINPNELEDGDIKDWYEEKYMVEGLYTKAADDGKYVLLAAGVQNTGGYSVEITSVEGNEEEVVVEAKLNVPSKDMMVTQALTYPNILIKIDDTTREVVLGNFDKPAVEVINNTDDEEENVETVTGLYTGQIDANSIEMEIKEVPMAFRLSVNAKITLKEENIKVGEVITVDYIENEQGQYIIQEIYKEPGYKLNK